MSDVAAQDAARDSVHVLSFGCRLNLVEGEAMRRAALAAGRHDLAIVNTCGVTGEAVRQARQAIRRLKREAPTRDLVVTGCAAQMDAAAFAAMPEVDRVVGNGAKTAVATWRGGSTDDGATLAEVVAGRSPLEEGVEDHTRAFLSVQNGCDHSCTFCAIPLGRGPSRSAPLADVVRSAARLAEQG